MLAVAASTPCMGFIPLAPPTVFYTPLAPPASSRASAHLMEMKMGENSQKLQPWWKRRPTGRPTGTLILLRHGETAVPRGTSFLGWSDADLNQMGEQGTAEAAQAIRQAGYSFDVAYTSVLKRAVRTTWLLLQELDKIYLPVWKNWRLNERCYGALTAEPVDELQRKYGDDKVASFRRSFDQRPPPFEPNSQHNPANDPRYERWQDRKGKIRQVSLPNGESLLDVCERVTPVWKREILPDLRRGRSVLVVAHGNSIRAIVQAIDDLSDEDMADIEIPPCIPLVRASSHTRARAHGCHRPCLITSAPYHPKRNGSSHHARHTLLTLLAARVQVYRFERKGAIESLAEGAAEGAIASARLAGLLATVRRQIRDDVADALRRRLRGGKERARDYDIVPVVTDASAAPLSGEFLATSSKLIAAQDRMRAASMARYGIGEASAENQLEQNAGTYGAFMTPANSADAVAGYEPTLASTMPMRAPPLISSGPPPPPEAMIALPGGGAMVSKGREKRQQHVVIIRHGKTEHNKLGLFTGWEDVSLAKEGRAEAMAAGKMLARHGFKFDVVYTSWYASPTEPDPPRAHRCMPSPRHSHGLWLAYRCSGSRVRSRRRGWSLWSSTRCGSPSTSHGGSMSACTARSPA